MRIFIDGTTLCSSDGSVGVGIEHYTWSLVRALVQENESDDLIIFVPESLSRQKQTELLLGARRTRVVRPIFPRVRFLSHHVFLPIRAWLSRADIFFSPFGQLPFLWKGKSIITVHDVLIFDHPEWFSRETKDSFSTKYIVPLSIMRANGIICVSQFTQKHLHARFPKSKGKTTVVEEGVEMGMQKEIENAKRFPFDQDFVLMLGTIEPRKNFQNAFAAFEKFFLTHPEMETKLRLIVAGKYGYQSDEIVNSARANPNIHFLGSITEEEKWYLLSKAACLLFPSFEEGFGLPILEALSVGTPVITSKNSALEEIGGDVVLYVDPEDVEGMSLAIAQCVLVPDGVQFLREQGYRRAVNFSWHNTASLTKKFMHYVFTHCLAHDPAIRN